MRQSEQFRGGKILTIDNCKGFLTEDLVEACDAASKVQLIMAGDSLREKHAFTVALGLVNAPTDQVTRQQLRAVQRELVSKGSFVQNMSFDGASRGLAYNVCPCLPTDVCSCSADKFKPVFASHVVRGVVANMYQSKEKVDVLADRIISSVAPFVEKLKDCMGKGPMPYSMPGVMYGGYFPDLTGAESTNCIVRIHDELTKAQKKVYFADLKKESPELYGEWNEDMELILLNMSGDTCRTANNLKKILRSLLNLINDEVRRNSSRGEYIHHVSSGKESKYTIRHHYGDIKGWPLVEGVRLDDLDDSFMKQLVKAITKPVEICGTWSWSSRNCYGVGSSQLWACGCQPWVEVLQRQPRTKMVLSRLIARPTWTKC